MRRGGRDPRRRALQGGGLPAVRLGSGASGSKTEEHQIRFNYSQFVVPTWQVLLSVSRDVSATGQFKQDFGLLLRIAKVL